MPTVPSNQHLVDLISAFLENAAALAEDAALLYENDRYARAYALAALAGEELGKVYLCLESVLKADGAEPRQFWRAWREHGDKLGSARAYAAAFIDDLGALDVDQLAPDARTVAAQKLSAIYVDFDGESALTPARISGDDAAQLLETTRTSIAHARQELAGLTMDVVVASHVLGPALSAFFDKQIDGKVPAEALGELRQLLHDVRGMTPEQVLELLRAQQPR
jgi:AbiV family abortive infection protein